MANKRLSYSDIAEPKLFDPLKKEILEVQNLLANMSEELKGIVSESANLTKQNPLKGYKDIKDVNRELQKQKKAVSDLQKIEKDKAKLEEKLKNLKEGRLDANIKLRAEIQKRTKQIKDEAILNSKNTGEYAKQSKILTKLKKEYKDLAVAGKANTKEAVEYLEEITKLDKKLKDVDSTVGENTRRVGSYEKAVGKLQKQLNRLAAAAGAIAIFDKLSDAINSNRSASDGLQKIIARVTITLQVFVSRSIKGLEAFKNIFTGVSINAQKLFLQLKKGFADLPKILGGSAEKSKELDKQIDSLNAKSKALSGGGLSDVLNAYKGIGEEIKNLLVKNDKLIENTTAQEKAVIALTESNAILAVEQAKIEQRAGDSTLSIRENQKALEKLNAINLKIAKNNIEIAQEEFKIARDRAAIRTDDLEAQRAAADAFANLEQVKAEAAVQAADVVTEQRQISIDQAEAELDILFDVSDRRKTVLEQQAADERLSLEKRRKAIEDANRGIEETYNQVEEVIGEIDLDRLLQIEDLQKLNEEIDNLNVGKQIRNRIREGLVERLAVVQDLEVAQRDLNDAQNEYNKVSEDVITQEEILKDIQEGKIDAEIILNSLEEKRIENTVKRLKKEIALAQEGSTARIKLQQELNDILIEQATKQAEKQAGIEEKAQQKRVEQIDKAKELFNLLGEQINKQLDKQIEKLDKLIDKSKQREEQLREAAQRGVQDAEENLALQAQITEEAERQRQRAIQRQKQAELAITALQIYSAKVQAGDKNALTSTITDISLLRGFIDSLPAFYEGSERVADDLEAVIPGRDGHIIRVDGEERILNPTHAGMIPADMTNYELAKLAHSSKNANTQLDVSGVEKRLELVAKKIENLELYQGLDFDKSKEAIVYLTKKKMKLERKHRKTGGVWG